MLIIWVMARQLAQNGVLWQRAIQWLGQGDRGRSGDGLINVSMLHWLDEPKIVSVLTELYYVGERPSAAQVDRFIAGMWPGADSTRKRIVSFWRRILKNPQHRFVCIRERGWSWRYPFLVLEKLAQEDGLPPIGDLLRTQLTAAADTYVAALGDDPGSDGTLRAARDLAAAAQALTVWGATRDVHPDAGGWHNPFALRHDPGRQFAWQTNAGRAREQRRRGLCVE